MKVNPFTPLFVHPTEKAKFKKDDTAASPKAPAKSKIYRVEFSRLFTYDVVLTATSPSDAERQAKKFIPKDLSHSIDHGWEIDDIIDDYGVRVKSAPLNTSPY